MTPVGLNACAEEIERLRSELAKARKALKILSDAFPGHSDIQRFAHEVRTAARAALQEEKKG